MTTARRPLLNNSFLQLVLAGLYPALFFASNNWFSYTKTQLALLIILTPLFALSSGVICYAILIILRKALLKQNSSTLIEHFLLFYEFVLSLLKAVLVSFVLIYFLKLCFISRLYQLLAMGVLSVIVFYLIFWMPNYLNRFRIALYPKKVMISWLIFCIISGCLFVVLLPSETQTIDIIATGQKNKDAKASEVWVLERGNHTDISDFAYDDSWERRKSSLVSYKNQPATARLFWRGRLRTINEIYFLKHPWSGVVEVIYNGKSEKYDLYATKRGYQKVVFNTPKFTIHLLVVLICCIMLGEAVKNWFKLKHSGKDKDLFFALFSSAMIFFLFQKSYTTLIPKEVNLVLILSALIVVILFAVYKLGPKPLNLFLIFLVSFSATQWIYSYYTSTIRIREFRAIYSKDKNFYDNIRFQKKPNVYLIVLESYHNNKAMKSIYNFDNQETEKELARRGFTIFNNAYSNYSYTMSSLLSMFTLKHHYYNLAGGSLGHSEYRNIIGGVKFNPVLTVFSNNGYKNQYIHKDNYLFFPSEALSYASPPRKPFKVFEIFGISQLILLDDFFRALLNTYQGNKGGYIVEKNFQKKMQNRIIIASDSTTPYFTFIKLTLPGHHGALWNAMGSKEWYIKNVKKADTVFLKLVDLILEQDSEAFIILISDHGATRYRRVDHGGNDIHMLLKKRGFQEEVVAQDLFGTFLAIKFPQNAEAPLGVISHVNLFRYIFSVLCENDSILQTKVDDESYRHIDDGEAYIVVRDGKPLKRWLPFHQ